MRSLISKMLTFTFASAAVLASVNLAQAGRYTERPPVVLSPSLSGEWVMQLQGAGAGLAAMKAAKRAKLQQDTRAATTREKTAKRSGVDPRFLPATVSYNTEHSAGTIVIDTSAKHLYLVLGNGKARRYGVGVGKAGFEWSGTERVSRKAKWPSWRPPAQMIAREKLKGRNLPTFMEGGPDNPLGARALYLGSTLYRIHGTNQPWTIGKALSSGCIRMRNQDVTALYEQISVGTKVVVL